MSASYDVRLRYSFPELSRSLMDTGRAMAAFAELAVEAIAPELSWAHAVAEHADYGLLERWEATHVVAFEGRAPDGALRGRAESRLTAGGQGSRIGGTARILIETVRPTRHVEIRTPCDVTHWDLRGGPLTDAQLDALRRLLETTLERGSESTAPIREELELGDHELAEGVGDEDARLWLGDLADSGLRARTEDTAEGRRLVLERADLAGPDELQAARITLGEIFAEAGHEDWDERALAALLRVPSA